jgi:two-component system OmpR family response regulator
MLPGMSGYAVCERIRQAGSTVPVLMLSARTLAEDRTRGFDVGANQYMNKPFELDELISRVKNLLQTNAVRSVATPADRIDRGASETRFGNVYVNFDTHQCQVNGKEVRVTSKEVRLLRYFVDNPGRVISRSELLSEVWDVTGNLQTRAVDQFIARLRKIIELDSSNPVHLLTIRDAGYRFLPGGDADDD